MSDLIKREDALALVEQWYDIDDYLYSTIINDITNLPAIDLTTLTSNSVDDSKTTNPVINDPAAIREAALQARIEQLVKERDEARIAINQIGEAMGVLGIVQCLDDIVAEAKKRFAKLTKAVAVLRFYTHDYVLSGSKARAVLAELEGK